MLDNRLYRESPKEPVKPKPKARKGRQRIISRDPTPDPVAVPQQPWELVCHTAEDWEAFPEQFAKSRNRDEKYLHNVISEDIRPQVLEELQVLPPSYLPSD